MPFARLFRSRWAALFWAGGILWTAIDVAGISPATSPAPSSPAPSSPAPSTGQPATRNVSSDADTDATGVPVTSDDLAILANTMGGG